jgi:hypothetical protein
VLVLVTGNADSKGNSNMANRPTGCHVHALEDGGWFDDGFARGALTDVTLRWGNEFARCDGILIWEDEPKEVLEEYFREWQAEAERGVAGYTTWTVDTVPA